MLRRGEIRLLVDPDRIAVNGAFSSRWLPGDRRHAVPHRDRRPAGHDQPGTAGVVGILRLVPLLDAQPEPRVILNQRINRIADGMGGADRKFDFAEAAGKRDRLCGISRRIDQRVGAEIRAVCVNRDGSER